MLRKQSIIQGQEKKMKMQDERRRRDLPVRRRHEGITAVLLVEADTWIALGASFLAYGLAK